MLSGEIRIVIDEIRAIANSDVSQGQTEATTAKTAFQGHTIPASAFSPLAAGIAAQQDAVHQVFVETIQGVVSDLETFYDNLIACADNHDSTDGMNQQALLALNRRMEGHKWRSNSAYDRSRQEAGSALPTKPQHAGPQHASPPGHDSAPGQAPSGAGQNPAAPSPASQNPTS